MIRTRRYVTFRDTFDQTACRGVVKPRLCAADLAEASFRCNRGQNRRHSVPSTRKRRRSTAGTPRNRYLGATAVASERRHTDRLADMYSTEDGNVNATESPITAVVTLINAVVRHLFISSLFLVKPKRGIYLLFLIFVLSATFSKAPVP